MCLVKTENLSIQFTNQPLLEAVNFSVQSGDKVVITRESGTGKTVHKVIELFFQDPTKTVIASSHHPEWINRSDNEIKIEYYAPNP